MPIEVNHLGMAFELHEREVENTTYFRYCAAHEFRLQCCDACGLIRYPPTTACPWCANPGAHWVAVEGEGTVHSYTEIHHAIQPAFKPHVPYLVLLVELNTQRGVPTPHEALRVVGNLTNPDGTLAPRDIVESVGIGSAVKMVFTDVAPGLSLPQWTLDHDAPQPQRPWRYPGVTAPSSRSP
jgi:uncharacterized OB-fold protein